MENADRVSRTKQLCRLEKGGSQIAFLLTDTESGNVELKVTRSDTSSREVQSFRVREDAMAEMRRRHNESGIVHVPLGMWNLHWLRPWKMVLDQMATSNRALSAAVSHKMSKQTGTDAPEETPPHPHIPRQVDAPDDVGRQEIDSIDGPDGEEDLDGYGHGV